MIQHDASFLFYYWNTLQSPHRSIPDFIKKINTITNVVEKNRNLQKAKRKKQTYTGIATTTSELGTLLSLILLPTALLGLLYLRSF